MGLKSALDRAHAFDLSPDHRRAIHCAVRPVGWSISHSDPVARVERRARAREVQIEKCAARARQMRRYKLSEWGANASCGRRRPTE